MEDKLWHTIPPRSTLIETYCSECTAPVNPVANDECPECGALKPFSFGHEINKLKRSWYREFVLNQRSRRTFQGEFKNTKRN